MEELRVEAEKMGIRLSKGQLESFDIFFNELTEWNEKFNLTAIKEKDEVLKKHFVDSLTIIPYLPKDAKKVIDIGSGAGFPGLPIKIAQPELNMTLTDSTGKKVNFINNVIQKLGLKGTIAINNRAEEIGQSDRYREKFDVALARAVAYLPVLCEYTLPLVRVGGIFIAQKAVSDSEVEDSKRAIEILGGKIKEIIKIDVAGLTDRQLIIIEKIRETPDEFPRLPGLPKQNPLI
ncbi:MAG: 16S rRNA (guanine(527)-N(7))-methyltransferase RsmG [Minisyncoccia bacterium]